MLKFTLSLLLFCIFSNTMVAQTTPLRIVENSIRVTETNSKLGEHTQIKKRFEIIYKDGTREILSQEKLQDLLKVVPEAQLSWKKHKANNLYRLSSVPFVVVGFTAGVNYFNGTVHKKRDAMVGILGLASAVYIFNYFDHKATRHKNKMLLTYNRHWSLDKPKNEDDEFYSPDVIRLGTQNNGSFGLGMTWFLDKK